MMRARAILLCGHPRVVYRPPTATTPHLLEHALGAIAAPDLATLRRRTRARAAIYHRTGHPRIAQALVRAVWRIRPQPQESTP